MIDKIINNHKPPHFIMITVVVSPSKYHPIFIIIFTKTLPCPYRRSSSCSSSSFLILPLENKHTKLAFHSAPLSLKWKGHHSPNRGPGEGRAPSSVLADEAGSCFEDCCCCCLFCGCCCLFWGCCGGCCCCLAAFAALWASCWQTSIITIGSNYCYCNNLY